MNTLVDAPSLRSEVGRQRFLIMTFAALCLVSASEAYLLACRRIQDRLAVRNNRRHALLSAIVTYGVGYALSRLVKRFGMNRFTPKAIC